MLSLIAILLTISVVHADSSNLPPNSTGSENSIYGMNSHKVIGGDEVQNCTKYPYQVSLQYRRVLTGENPHFCGGSILNKDYILTAGHCADGLRLPSFVIVLATHKLNTLDTIDVRRNAAKITIHKNYNPEDLDYDIALIKLDTSLDLENNCISSVVLPEQDEEIPSGTLCTATGFGSTAESSAFSNVLRIVRVPVVSQEDCRASYGVDDITPRMLCAGLESGGKDACQGDSGGPLTVNGKQIGITSWGHGCGRPGFFGVYTRVAFFSQWIKDQIN